LPSTRALNHKNPLIPRAKPINMRPYKSSYMYKEEIERLVKEMLGME
jgi:hypothetical protein